MDKNNDRKNLTIEECVKYLKMSVSTIYRLAQQGKIPATKVGNQWRFQKKKIDEWLEKGGNLKKRRDHEQKRSIQQNSRDKKGI